MNCQQAKPLIEPYVDGELGAAAMLKLENHIKDCAGCTLVWRNLQGLKRALKQDALFFRASPELRRRVKAELHSQFEPTSRRNFWNWHWLTAATASLAIACLVLLSTVLLTRPSAEQLLAHEIVSSHIRSLMASHVLDVVSADQHTVKPWFNGKLDFSPPVKDLTAQEFALIGGRLDYLCDRSVAALVFLRHKHIINLFIWPAVGVVSKSTTFAPIQGYNLIHWSQSGMTFWAVSDLNKNELLEFVQDYKAEAPLK